MHVFPESEETTYGYFLRLIKQTESGLEECSFCSELNPVTRPGQVPTCPPGALSHAISAQQNIECYFNRYASNLAKHFVGKDCNIGEYEHELLILNNYKYYI